MEALQLEALWSLEKPAFTSIHRKVTYWNENRFLQT